ncbi:MAG: hypothetical protein AAF267_05625 [Deinococcota bacterium]
MINASQRQRDQNTRDGLWQHLRLAQRFYWQTQLWHCALAGLAASVFGYVLGLPFLWHTVLTGLGFAVGFAWRSRHGKPKALRYIEDEIGLSYSTAVELQADIDPRDGIEQTAVEGFDDSQRTLADTRYRAFFAKEVTRRANYRVRRLEQPKLQPWWLPMVALALILIILPNISLPRLPRRLGPNQPPPTQANGRPLNPLAEETAADDPLTEQPNASSPESESRPDEVDGERAAELEDFDTPDDSDAPPAGEGDTLDRFVEGLGSSQSTESADSRPQPSEPDEPEPQAGGNAVPRAGDQNFREIPPDDRVQNVAQGETPQGSGEFARDTGSDPSDQNSEQGDADGDGRLAAADSNAPPEDSGAGEESQEGEAQAEQEGGDPQAGSQSQPESSPTDTPESGGNPQDTAADASQDAGDAGFDESLNDPSNGTGDRGGRAETDDGELGDASDPEQLESTLQEGVINVGGQVRLPGDDEVTLPVGSSPEVFERGIEQALSEGRIPVEYQEILRSYFR